LFSAQKINYIFWGIVLSFLEKERHDEKH